MTDSHRELKDWPSGLLTGDAYPHPTEQIRLVETHISWVILTGKYAYKIKKPVKLDFLDFSSVDRRHQDCLAEVEINRAFAPDIYLGVVPIYCDETSGLFHLGKVADGELTTGNFHSSPAAEQSNDNFSHRVIDFAVAMLQFPADALVLNQLQQGNLSCSQMDHLARQVAQYHYHAQIMAFDPTWSKTCLIAPAIENATYLLEHLTDDHCLSAVRALDSWIKEQLSQNNSSFSAREKGGKIRWCHGDLHLANIIWQNDRFTAFDAIEFNEEFRHIDTISEIAFMIMELDAYQYPQHANRLLSEYLEVTNDYGGLNAMPFYLVYRSMIRAKVDLMTRIQKSGNTKGELSEKGLRYLALAQQYCTPRIPKLWITFGMSGSGKSWRSLEIIEKHGMIRIRSDYVRKYLIKTRQSDTAEFCGLKNQPRIPSYTSDETQQTYEMLAEVSKIILDAGYSVIVDATFLKRKHRDMFRAIADNYQADFGIVSCEAPLEELRRRICERKGDLSDATLDVLDSQWKTHEELSHEELSWVVRR